MDILTRIELRALAFELITHTPNRLDVVTLASKLTPKLLYMGINCPGISKITCPVDCGSGREDTGGQVHDEGL